MPKDDKIITFIKAIFRTYRDGNLSIDEFYYLSQLECYYCGVINSNRYYIKYPNKSYEILYNGLDRVDNNFGHINGNVVPCCKRCNVGKSNINLEKFQDWMMRVQEFQKNTKNIEKLLINY